MEEACDTRGIQSLCFLDAVRGVVHTKYVVLRGSLRDCFFSSFKASPDKGRGKRGGAGETREEGRGKAREQGGRRCLETRKETIFGELRASQNHEFSSHSLPENM